MLRCYLLTSLTLSPIGPIPQFTCRSTIINRSAYPSSTCFHQVDCLFKLRISSDFLVGDSVEHYVGLEFIWVKKDRKATGICCSGRLIVCMGGLLHLFDFNAANTARKQKKHGGGADPPRNSLDLPVETLHNYYGLGEGTQKGLEKRNTCSTDASVKKLINEEVSRRRNSKHNAPSLVARLMGMDILPNDSISKVQPLEKSTNIAAVELNKQASGKVSGLREPKRSRFYRPQKPHSSNDYKDTYSPGKPQPRAHPQEKELQQFKKEFEAWQAARFMECARLVELGNIPDQWLAQLNLNKEKMDLYENARKAAMEKDNAVQDSMSRSRSLSRKSLQYSASIKELSPAAHKDPYFSRSNSSGRQLEQLSQTESDQKSDKAPSSTRIVLLKPGPDSFCSNEESWISSTSSIEDRDSIEDLLEEVKEKLKCELQGKPFTNGFMVRGGGIETPFKEVRSPSSQVAQHIASHVRERNLLRSESARSYRSEFQNDQTGSPQYTRRDTRTLLSERLRNVINGESNPYTPDYPHGSPRESMSGDARHTLEQARNILNAENRRPYRHNTVCEQETQGHSFRQDLCNEGAPQEVFSPRNLVRSLSAPVSGTSFGRLLLEDRHVLTGGQLRRKHEALGHATTDYRSQKRERFNIRAKVSNIRYSLREKLFSRKLQSMELSQKKEFDSMEDTGRGPTVMMNCEDIHENFTEVPPSPASVCSNGHEELWKPANYSSPVSTSDVTSVGDQSVGNVFREISSNLSELRRQLNQLECDESEVTTVSEEPYEAEVLDLEDEAEVYIRDLLVASGLYDGSCDKSFLRWDPFIKPISNLVFEKVEESYKNLPVYMSSTKDDDEYETHLQHRLLFDLLNEALSTVFSPPKALPKFSRKVICTTMVPPPRGMKLLERVWKVITEHITSADKSYNSLDDVVADDLNFTPWFGLIDQDITVLAKELEYQITGDLIEEVYEGFEVIC